MNRNIVFALIVLCVSGLLLGAPVQTVRADPRISSPAGESLRLIDQGQWTGTVSMNGAPSFRGYHTAFWTGSQMLIWGGMGCLGCYRVDGALYNPATHTWTAISTKGAPPPRAPSYAAVWTGTDMIIWGGDGPTGVPELNDGYRYNLSTNSWTQIASSPLTPRWGAKAVWTGTDMIVWGGTQIGGLVNNGARYNPVTNSWTMITSTNAPSVRGQHYAIWTGSEMIVWGGIGLDGSSYAALNSGGRYNPNTDTWTAVTTNGAPSGRYSGTAVWSGKEMLVWGGKNLEYTNSFLGDGARYDPATGIWTAMSTSGLSPRWGSTAIWTGSEMIVWGGNGYNAEYNDGARYGPTTNTWTAVSTSGAPATRWAHTAVWTGDAMIVWGGASGAPGSVSGFRGDGGIYQPGPAPVTQIKLFLPFIMRK